MTSVTPKGLRNALWWRLYCSRDDVMVLAEFTFGLLETKQLFRTVREESRLDRLEK